VGGVSGFEVQFNDPRMPERFWNKIEQDPSGCWLWVGYTSHKGYARMVWGSRKWAYAHRIAYEQLVGPIPEHLPDCDHLCRVRNCVNPNHIEPVTHLENVRRGLRCVKAATHCRHGHAYDEENTYVSSTGARACRACGRLRQKAARQAARKAVL
jgi:hypothetical protein